MRNQSTDSYKCKMVVSPGLWTAGAKDCGVFKGGGPGGVGGVGTERVKLL